MAKFDTVEGSFVHFPDQHGQMHQGTVVAAWLSSEADSVRITVQCSDNKFREAWLTNCTSGSIPKPKEDKK